MLGLSSDNEPLELLAEIGITVLLFVVGLKLDMRLVRTLGPAALATGLGQLSFTIIFGFTLCYLMGLELMTALCAAVALTTLVGLITTTLSTYMILYSKALFDRLAPWLGIIERHIPHRENANDSDPQNTHAAIIIYGMARYGRQLAHQLEAGGLRVLGVDSTREPRNEGLSAC